MLEKYTSPEEAKAMKDELNRLRQENTTMSLEAHDQNRHISEFEGERSILHQDVQDKTSLVARLRIEVASLSLQLQHESEKRGEELAWKEIKDALECQMAAAEKKYGESQARVVNLEDKLVSQRQGLVSQDDFNKLQTNMTELRRQMASMDAEAANKLIQQRAIQDKLDARIAEVRRLNDELETMSKSHADLKGKYDENMTKFLQEKYGSVWRLMVNARAKTEGGNADPGRQTMESLPTEVEIEAARAELEARKSVSDVLAARESEATKEEAPVRPSASSAVGEDPFKGDLTIEVISASGLRSADVASESDPYCMVFVDTSHEKQGGKALHQSTKYINNDNYPIWNETFNFAINWDPRPKPPAGSATGAVGIAPIRFKVYDKDVGRSGDFLGECEWAFPQESKTRQEVCLLLREEKGARSNRATGWISFMVTWVMSGQNPPHRAEDVKVKPKYIDNGINCDPFIGRMWFRIISATDLRGADLLGTSDPYVYVKMKASDGKKSETRTQKSIKNSLHAAFNEVLTVEINRTSTPVDDTIDVEVMDEDWGPDDHIGSRKIPFLIKSGDRQLLCCQLEDKKKAAGAPPAVMLLEYCFLQSGLDITDTIPPTTITKMPESVALPRVGQIIINVLSASGLRNADAGILHRLVGGSSDCSDPYCVVSVAGTKEKPWYTTVKDNTLDPQWQEMKSFNVMQFGSQDKKKKKSVNGIKVEVWDEDPGPDPDDFLGLLELQDVYDDMCAQFDLPLPEAQRYFVKQLLRDKKNDKLTMGHIDLEIIFIPLFSPQYMRIEKDAKTGAAKFVMDEEKVKHIEPRAEGYAWYAKDLLNETKMSGKLEIEVIGAMGLLGDREVASKPYCKVTVPVGPTSAASTDTAPRNKNHIKKEVRETNRASGTSNPIWKSKGSDGQWPFIFDVNWTTKEWPKEAELTEIVVEVCDGKKTIGSNVLSMPGIRESWWPVEEFESRMVLSLGGDKGELVLRYAWKPSGASLSGKPSSHRKDDLYVPPRGGNPMPLRGKAKSNGLVGQLRVKVTSASDLENVEKGGAMGWMKSIVGANVSDPFAKVTVPRTRETPEKKMDADCEWETKCISNTLDPVWNEEHLFDVMWLDIPPRQNLLSTLSAVCRVYHQGSMSTTLLGEVSFPLPRSGHIGQKCLAGQDRALRKNLKIRPDHKNVQGTIDIDYEFFPFFLQS
eukprot:GEMP01000515.1.p1 GENE.GEMP01000515.1~~GEMP01000515.1.p1  ORF type:complete len:1186 (+),score=234.05 GEMP01000515.1:3058-6615(+)